MNCTDPNIIALLRQPGHEAELQAVQCLMKCESQAAGLLLRNGLADGGERRSLFLESVAEFIVQVRNGKFVLTGAAKICTYTTEIARRKWLGLSRKTKDVAPEAPTTTSENERERDERLHEALLQLNDTDRDILTAFYFYDLPLDEYAQRNGLTHDAAKKRISRARERLKEILKPADH
ncbi:MAG: sigma-70 family RNA polymerase sigma factor [Saprospiraceae bacterium]